MQQPLAQINKLTLDQLLLLVTVAETGSFSAAARRLDRSQSTISHGVATLEAELGLELFDRSRRKPVLTPAGQHLLPQALQVLTQIRHLQSDAQRLAQGEESAVSIVLDMIIPLPVIIQSLTELQARFPAVRWLIHTEMLSAIAQRITEGSCQMGLTGVLPRIKTQMVSQDIGKVDFVYVVSSQHPLAQGNTRVSDEDLAAYTQLEVADRAAAPHVPLRNPQSWQFADLTTLLGFVLAHQGWAFLPLHLVWPELQAGRLTLLWPQRRERMCTAFSMYSLRLVSERPGPVRQQFMQAFEKHFQAYSCQLPTEAMLIQHFEIQSRSNIDLF